MSSFDRGSLLQAFRRSPTGSGIGLGLVAGLLTFLVPQIIVWLGLPDALAVLALLGFPVWFGQITGSAIPGWPGWRYFLIGWTISGIVGGLANAFEQPHNVYATNAQLIIIGIALGPVVGAILSSPGFVISVFMRRRRRASVPKPAHAE